MNDKNWEPCPRCGSSRVTAMGKGFWFALLFFGGGVLFWVGLLIWPVMIVALLMIFGSPLAFFIKKSYSCKDCNYNWKPGEKLEA